MNRTNTTRFTTFNLPFPNAATFTFIPSSPTSSDSTIRIVIPASSRWRMPYHWHPSENQDEAACKRVACLSGGLVVSISHGLSSYTEAGFEGFSVEFAPGQRIAWRRESDVPLAVDLVADDTLWRNICSATLDGDNFPQLASTPLWLKALFAILAVKPLWRNALLSLLLRIQVQAIFFAHGFHVYHGYIPLTWPWMAQPFGGRPPIWVKRLQLQSLLLISRVVMAISFWTGRGFLGMQGEYEEYTPNDEQIDEKS